MTFSRLILSTASIAAAVACAPAFGQQHEVGHWFGAPADPSAATQAFSLPLRRAHRDRQRERRRRESRSYGFVSRFPAGGRADAVPTTPLDDPGLQTRNARQEAKENKYYDIVLKNANVAAAGGRDMTLKGQNILQNARGGPAGGGHGGRRLHGLGTHGAAAHEPSSVHAVPPRVGTVGSAIRWRAQDRAAGGRHAAGSDAGRVRGTDSPLTASTSSRGAPPRLNRVRAGIDPEASSRRLGHPKERSPC